MNLDSALTRATDSAAQATADLDALQAATEQARHSLNAALHSAVQRFALARAAALTAFDQDALQAFLSKPYLTRPLGDGQYELIVPRFIGFRAGWPVRHTDAYSVFLVSRFIHFLNPLPDWMAQELGFTAPTFQATLDGNTLTVTSGNAMAVYEKLGGAKVITRREGDRLYLRPASRFDILRRIIREEGFLPYTPQPIPTQLRRVPQIASDERGHPAFELRGHQRRDYDRFLETGAVSVFAYPQTGKSYLTLMACAELCGPKLILAPRRALVDQWRARLALFLTPEAASEVTVTTYQGAARPAGAGKYLNHEWTLVVFDEAHHLPADFAIEAASRIKAVARQALSATPRREDGNEDLIPALGGFPVGADWPVKASQRPAVTVWIVKDEAAKLKHARQLCAVPADGKTFIFTYRLDIGERLARLMDVPFVQGKTKRPLDILVAHETVVVSSIGNEGLSFPVRRVVELDFLFGSKMEAGQRLGRLAYEITGKDAPTSGGAHHILMTPDEYTRYGKRLLMYEQWGLEIDVRTPDDAPTLIKRASVNTPRPRRTETQRMRSIRPRPVPQPKAASSTPADEIDTLLALPAIAAKVTQAERGIGQHSAPNVRRVFRYCYHAALSAPEIADGLGLTNAANRSRLSAACKALMAVGLFGQNADGRYQVNAEEVNRLRALSALKKL